VVGVVILAKKRFRHHQSSARKFQKKKSKFPMVKQINQQREKTHKKSHNNERKID
jgi:hypothetical protein